MRVAHSLAVMTVMAVLTSCAKKSATAPPAPVTFSANLTSAIKVGRIRVAASALPSFTANTTTSADQDLVLIDALSQTARVFSASFPIYAVKATTHYLIVSGTFVSPTAADTSPVLDADGAPINCRLYAVSKTASGHPGDLICLSKTAVGDYDPAQAATNAHYSHLGFATSGTKVYFTNFSTGSLYVWNEGDATATKTATVALGGVGDGADDVFADPSSSNVCVLVAAIGPYTGHLECGTESNLSLVLSGSLTEMVLAETLQMGRRVLTPTKSINLATLAVTARTTNGSNGGLPAGFSNIAADANGGMVYIGYAWSLSMVTAAGATCALATTNGVTNTGCAVTGQTVSAYFQTLIGLGGYAWAYGTSDANDKTTGTQLRRVNLTTNVLEATNFMSATGLASISAMYLTPDNYIKIIGKDGTGAVATGVIDEFGNIAASAIVMQNLDIVLAL